MKQTAAGSEADKRREIASVYPAVEITTQVIFVHT